MTAFQASPSWGESVVVGRIPGLWVGKDAVDGTVAGWLRSPVGELYLYKPDETTAPILYMKVADNSVTADWVVIGSNTAATGFVGVPLTSVREVTSNAIPNAAGNGGLLASDTTPILNFTNADTDSALRLSWASSNSDAITFQVVLPPDLNDAKDVVLHFRAAMAGATDTPVISADTFFNEGDTKVEDDSAAVTGTTYAEYIVTIGAADVPAGAQTMSVELTPGAHTTDALYMTAVWVEYTKL